MSNLSNSLSRNRHRQQLKAVGFGPADFCSLPSFQSHTQVGALFNALNIRPGRQELPSTTDGGPQDHPQPMVRRPPKSVDGVSSAHFRWAIVQNSSLLMESFSPSLPFSLRIYRSSIGFAALLILCALQSFALGSLSIVDV